MKKLTCVLLTAILIFGALSISSCKLRKASEVDGVDQVTEKTDNKAKTEKKPTEKPTEAPETTPPELETVASSELSASQYKRLVNSYDSLIYSYGFDGEVFVTEHGKPIYKKGVNYADKKKKIKNNEYTLFRIASITKQFTAAAIMILQERGKLSVKDKLSKYFPDYKYGNKITIDNVLRMNSGIPDYMNFYNNVAKIFSSKAEAFTNSSKKNREIIKKSFMTDPILFTPGATFKYSNSGYLLLGEIVEKASGTTYENFLKKEIFDKLDMKFTGFIEDLDDKADNVAQPYNFSKGQLDVFKIKGAAFACGNMYSNAVDLAKWADGLRDNKVMSKKSFDELTKDKNHYGYACGLFVLDKGRVIFHTGNLAPYNSILLMSTGSSEYTCVVLSNHDYYASETLGKNLRSVYAGYFS